MSSESEDEDRNNYFQLRTFFEDDCTKLFRSVLENYFSNCSNLVKSIPKDAFRSENLNGFISDKDAIRLKSDNASFKKFNFELLCVVFETGVCDKQKTEETVVSNHQNTREDILQIMQIWRKYIANNEEEELSNNDNEMIWNILHGVACRLSNNFSTFGKRFLKKIEKKTSGRTTINNQIGTNNAIRHIASENESETIVCNQMGQENKFSSRNKIQRAPKTIVCTQLGETNKIIIELDDQTKSKKVLSIEGKGELRLTMHCSDPSFKEIADRIKHLPIEEVNKDEFLTENSIEVTSTQSACLIVDVKIKGPNVDIPLSMERLVECLMRRGNAFQVLSDNNVDELKIFGYYYQPGDYVDATDWRLNFSLFSHVTLKLNKTIVDVDVFVSDSLRKLTENSFQTDVDENIRMQIKGEIVDPKHLDFIDIQKTIIDHEDFLKSMNVSLATECQLQIVDILRRKSATHIILKTATCFTYGRLLENKGLIMVLLRKIFQLQSVAEKLSDILLLRTGVLINTSLDEDFDKKSEEGIVFYLSPGSKVTEVIEKNRFPELVQALLGEKNTKDIEQLKVKAVLEYDNGRNNSDSDPAIDITEEYERPTPEENISRNVELIKSNLESGNLLEARALARIVFRNLTDRNLDVLYELKDIFIQCADNFYALKCFCKVRLFGNEYWNPFLSLMSSRIYWIQVIYGPYELKDIKILFKEIEDIVIAYTDIKEYRNVAYGICFELLLSYRELECVFPRDKESILKRVKIVEFYRCKILYEKELYSQICEIYKQLDRDGLEMDVDNLYLWSKSLKHLEKTEVALKKIEEAIQLDSSERRTRMTTNTKCNIEEIRKLRDSLIFEMNQIPEQTGLDTEWLAGTNISVPQHMKERAQQVKEQHVKKLHRRPKKQRDDNVQTPLNAELLTQEKEHPEYKRWKDVRQNTTDISQKTSPRKRQTKKRVEQENDFNVEIVERQKSESDSGQESYSESEEPKKKPFTYEAPEYQHFETDVEMFSDSGFDTFDEESQFDNSDSTSSLKAPNNSELVVSGITLTDRCETSFHQKAKTETFKYQEMLSKDELLNRLQRNKHKFKKCVVEIESAHKAVCMNMDLADEVKEIIISGRSKCGKVFTDDEVVVEILGESKAQKNNIPRLKIDLTKETKDNNIYGKIIGRLKRNRYEDLKHPVLICAKDDFSKFSMKPLCKTVPKIKVSHKHCKHEYQVDLFSYDGERNVVEFRETLTIDHAHKNAYCFLVAMIHWDNMYPFGLVLKVVNTKGDVKSGLGILRLQYRVPCHYSKDATEATKLILQQKHQVDDRNRKVTLGFTITEGKQGAQEAAYSVTKLESDLYRIGIHIVDPTSVIKKGDAIDKEAKRRGTDFYVNKDVQPVYMIQERLSNELFNMEPGKERKTLTVLFDVAIDSNSGSVLDNFKIVGEVGRQIIKPEKVYNISDVQTLLKAKRTKSEISILHVVSKHLRKERLKNATFFTGINDMFPYEKNNFIECLDAFVLVKELYIFANQTVAAFLFNKYPKCVPCVCHPRPPETVFLKWKNSHEEHLDSILFQLQDCELGPGASCSVFNCNPKKLRYRHLIPIQNNVWEVMREAAKSKQFDKLQLVLGADEVHPMQALGLDNWIALQEKSEFRCSSPKSEHGHFDLRVPIFTYFTAPLSRFIDLVVHRLIHAALDKNTEPPYTEEEIIQICREMNQANRIRKQFRKSCLVFLFAHSLHSSPRIFNGFIQNVTNNDVELVFPTLRKLPRLSKILPLNLLKSKHNPEFVKEVDFDRFFMTIKWKNRIYSLKRVTRNSPKECYLRIDPNQNVQFHRLKKWVEIIQAFFNDKTKNIHSLMCTYDDQYSNQQIPACVNTVNDVSSEVRGGTFAQQTCSYSLSFIYGQILHIQMCADSQRGMLTPMPQLLDITPNVKICLQHTRDPLGILTSTTTKPTKEKYSSPKQYIDIWIPIFSMEVATQTVDGDSYTINDLPVTFRDGGGAFSLKHSFLEKRDIEFTSHSVDLLDIDEDGKDDSTDKKERFYMSGSDFLCIRCPLEPINDIVSNFGKGAISPLKRYWIGHAKVHDVKYKTKKNEKVVSVTFICHNKSPTIPVEMLNKKKECSVEILPKPDVCRRTELYVKCLESASDLAKAIALRRSLPRLDDIHVALGQEIRSASGIFESAFDYNDNQNNAIENALTLSFSLIQGPPGTGKTLTGVALIKYFCIVNQRYLEMSKDNKDYVVYCGPSNKSVDLVTANLKKNKGDLKILRMYGGALECKDFPIPGKVFSTSRADAAPDASLHDVSLHHIIREHGNPYAEKLRDFDKKFKSEKKIEFREVKEYKKFIAKAVREEIPKYDVILCTTSVATSSRLLNAIGRSIYQLLIDEAGMCTEPESIATIVATQAKQVVFIGDHKQLQPVVLCQEAENLGLQKSLFERYAESDISKKVLTLLTSQYRMHPGLCRFPSKEFYGTKLETDLSPDLSHKWEVLEPLSIWRDPEHPMVFCNTEGEEEYLANTSEEGNENSKFNQTEIDQVEKVYMFLVKQEGVGPENINIMSQYNAQCSKIRERLKKHNVQNVNTVVASQGGEWDYVIFSLVRSLPEYRIEPNPTDGWRKENLGFINDEHQINVALTRARKGLIIIGNKRLMKCNELFNKLLDDYGRRGCLDDAENFPPVLKRRKIVMPAHEY